MRIGIDLGGTKIEIAALDAADGAVLAQAQAAGFALHWRHSVTLTPVEARYALLPGGAIVQTEERFAAHGPGMAHDAPGWRREGEMFVLPLARAVNRLVLRAAAEHENRLAIAGQTIDLTRWPGVPIDLVPLPCEEIRP